MTHSLVVKKAAGLIRAGDIQGAENALVSLVETEGDHALVAVLDEMPPKDLLAVIREYDSSRESVVNLLVTPEQFAQAVVMEKLYGDHSHRHLRGMINSVIFRDEEQTGEFIAAIGEVDGGCEALIDYLSDRDEEVVHFATFDNFNLNLAEEGSEVDRSEVCDHDWKELTWLLKHEHPDMFDQIWPALKVMMAARRSLEEEEASEDAPEARPVRPSRAPAPAEPNVRIDPAEESAL
jgi:hypothetical protein